jgi:hypothetical protein
MTSKRIFTYESQKGEMIFLSLLSLIVSIYFLSNTLSSIAILRDYINVEKDGVDVFAKIIDKKKLRSNRFVYIYEIKNDSTSREFEYTLYQEIQENYLYIKKQENGWIHIIVDLDRRILKWKLASFYNSIVTIALILSTTFTTRYTWLTFYSKAK